jgi:hypothetical protein
MFIRQLAAVLFLTVISVSASANRIDSLKTDQDLVDFLQWVNKDFRNTKLKPIELRNDNTLRTDLACDGMAEKWQIKSWEKTDLNGDGRTDLLAILYWYDYGVYAVMDKGDDKFEFLTLSYNNSEKCEFAKPVVVNNQPLLLFYQKKAVSHTPGKGVKRTDQVDTLVYRNGDFIELNRNPANYGIDSIQFRTTYCMGSCPVFTISAARDGNAMYNAQTYNPKQGNFSGLIQAKNMEEIIDLINFIDIKAKENNYNVSWTDDQTAFIRVRFTDGTVKEIKDYGMKGNFGLRLLYKKFFDLRTNQNWQPK